MGYLQRAGHAAILLLLILELTLASALGTSRVRAADDQPPGPDRFVKMVVDYTSYEWWLARWADNEVACQVFIDHEGLPTGSEIYLSCGESLYNQWAATQPCAQAEDDSEACKGYYLLFIDSAPAQREIGVTLPPPVVWVTLEGCDTISSANHCDSLPSLMLTGEEPLPNETITGISGTIDGKAFECAPICYIDLGPTDEDGLSLEFWAYSSYGDSSEVFTAQVRVVAADETASDTSLYVDVLSTQWRGAPLAGCSQTWEAFPPIGGLPEWLSTPGSPTELNSKIPYAYLAANLITQGVVDASACLDDGLLSNGLASPCGVNAALPAVAEWQNRFDKLIFNVAQDTGIPAQLLKNLFSRESQFWPGIFTNTLEVGLGQMTENGADTTLLWNPSFYEQFCPLVLDNSVCRKGYPQLKADEQAMLRGALVRNVDAFCPGCPFGLDLRQADFSVAVFAETLQANCEQSGIIIHNVSGGVPGEVSTYEDLWKFTLVNYNAGPGCLVLAMQETKRLGEPFDWEHVSAHLTEVCQGAIDYVGDISQ